LGFLACHGMLNGLLWMPKQRRKRFCYRHRAARLITLSFLNTSPKAHRAPLHTVTACHRLRRRLKGNFLTARSRSPLQYHLLQALVLAPIAKPTCSPRVDAGLRSSLVPLRYAPSYISVSMRGRPIRASLRVFYLLLSSPTNGAVSPSQPTSRWAVAVSGSLSKAPFGSL
jgi:hypothetical protein